MTRNRPTRGGDLMTISRQQNGGFLALLPKIFGFGPGEMQKQMSDPTKLQQVVMQRGGFPWALAGLSLLPMLMGKGKDDAIRKQMGTTRDPIMQRGGLSIPPTLLAKGLPLLKAIGIPLAMGALASVGDNVVDKVFGDGSKRSNGNSSSSSSRKKTPRAIRSGRRQRSTVRTGSRRPRKTVGRTARRNKARTPKAGSKQQQQQQRRRRQHRKSTNTTSSSFSSLWRKGKDMARDQLQTTGRRLFEKVKRKTKSKVKSELASRAAKAATLIGSKHGRQLTDSPFARKIRENISMATATPTLSSSHIGQSFNI